MKGYKLTDKDGYTRRGQMGQTLWTIGKPVGPYGEGDGPCGPGVLHFYGSPEEAVLYDSIHGNYGSDARLWECKVPDDSKTDGMKWWTTGRITLTEELPRPEIDTLTRVAWAICLAPHDSTRDWAIKWLSGKNRTAAAARAAGRAARAARAAAWVAERVAAAARAAAESDAAWAAAWVAEWVAEWAARVAGAAEAAAGARSKFSSRSLSALARARNILAGRFPAEDYDKPLGEDI